MAQSNARRKKSYLLDPRFQLKWTGYLVVVVFFVMLALGLLIGKIASNASDTAAEAVAQAEKAAKESETNNILSRRNLELNGGENAALNEVMGDSLKEEEKKVAANLSDVKKRRDAIASNRSNIQLTLIAAGIALIALLFAMGVVITHRIVGPVHKMKRLLRRVSTGRLVIEERLRKGDELEDLFDTFLQMTYSLRAQQVARLATLDGTIRRAETTSTPEEVLEGLRALRAQLVLGLEPRRPSMRPPPSM